MIKLYYLFDKETLIVNQTGLSTTRQSPIPEYPRDALTIIPLEEKKGFKVLACEFDENGKPHATEYVEDHIGKMIYNKIDCNQSEEITKLGPVLDDWTLVKPSTQFDSWNVALGVWQYDEARYRPHWIETEKQWQQEVLTKVEAELLFYAQDKQIPEIYSELRKTNYTEDDYYSLLGDRILLNEYVEQEDFPECGRPTLSGLVK